MPSQTVATQTENTAQSFPTLQQKTSTLTQYGTKSTETEISDVNRNKQLGSLDSNDIDVCTQEGLVESSNTTSVAVSHTSPHQVIDCDSDDAKSVPDAEKSKASKKGRERSSKETFDEAGDKIQRQLSFDDTNNTLAIGKDVYNNGDDEGGDGHVRDGTSDDEHAIGGDKDGKRNIHVDATTDDDTNTEDQNSATQLDSDDDKDVDYVGDESNADRSQYSVDIPNPPTKVRKTIKGKQKNKGRMPREVFPCTYCTRKCTTKSIYEKHIEWHTRSKETKCNICGKEFSQPGYLINHLEKHQQARKHGHGEEGNEGTDTVVKDTELAECRYCGKLMRGEILVRHEIIHTRPREKQIMNCSYCVKTYTSRSEFQRHERTHTNERPYKCNRCESAFYCNKDLTIHIRRHLGDKRYKCDHCGKAFVRKCNLDEHLRTHTGARPYKCNYCDKSFGFKNVLKVHLVQHTGVRPHVCEYCDKGFAKKSFLDKHVTSQHE